VRSTHQGQWGTPFEVAREVGNDEIAALLVGHGAKE
jgi:hypothetical protein